MKSKKDKQIRELRKNRDNWFYVGMIFIVFSIFLGGWIGYLRDTTVPDLKSQFQSCQEKVPEPIYTLYILPDGSVHKTTYYESNNSYTVDKPFKCGDNLYFGDYYSYKINCEVLE